MRDASDIALKTLRAYLIEKTQLTGDRVWLQYPNDDFLNERTFNDYPAISIVEYDQSNIEYSNYGDVQVTSPDVSGRYTTFSPLGRKYLTVDVSIYCETQAQRRLYRSMVEVALLDAKFLSTVAGGDVLQGEYIDIKVMYSEMTDDKPYVVSFYLSVQTHVFKEELAYLVNDIEIRGVVAEELNISSNVPQNLPVWFEINPSGMVNDGGLS